MPGFHGAHFPVLHWRICKLKGERKLGREAGEKRERGKQKEKEGVGGRGVAKGHNQRRGHGARQKGAAINKKERGDARQSLGMLQLQRAWHGAIHQR